MVLGGEKTGWGLCFRKTPPGGARPGAGRAWRRLRQDPGQERMKARLGQRWAFGMDVKEEI